MKINIEITECPNKDELLNILDKIVDYVKNDFSNNGKTETSWNNNNGIIGKSDTVITYPVDNAERNYLISEAKNVIENVMVIGKTPEAIKDIQDELTSFINPKS